MTKITIYLSDDEDKQLKYILVEKNVSKANYIEQVFREHLNIIKAENSGLKLVEED